MGKEVKMKEKILGIIFSLSLIVAIFFTSFEIAAYSDWGFYEKEYRKFEVAKDLGMEYPDIMDVTKYMMDYLRGREERLTYETKIEGEVKDFFNGQDRFHMAEVRDLFLGGYAIRNVCAIICVVTLGLIIYLDKNWKSILGKMYQRTLIIFMGGVAVLGTLIAMNFNKCFLMFHKIFFDNDLWIFDPATDYMIRMLPEGFFFDMVVRIGVIFIILLVATYALFRKTYKKF